jgi:hypothetical protein
MNTYNHTFSISFEVEESSYNDPRETWAMEKDTVIKSLICRLQQFLNDEISYMEAFNICSSTIEE